VESKAQAVPPRYPGIRPTTVRLRPSGSRQQARLPALRAGGGTTSCGTYSARSHRRSTRSARETRQHP